MPEDLLRQILEELRGQGTPSWLEALKLTVPLAGGLFTAGIAVYAVWWSGKTQRDTVKQMSETQLKVVEESVRAQQASERSTRRSAWRGERYDELLAALAERLGASRSAMTAFFSWNSTPASDPALQQQQAQTFREELAKLTKVDLSSRVFKASLRIADKTTADLAQAVNAKLTDVSQGALQLLAAISPAGQSAPEIQANQFKTAHEELQRVEAEALAQCYELNQRIEDLIAEAD